MSRSQQQKGRAGELELAAILGRHGFTIIPGTPLNYGMEPDLSGLPGIHIEVKRVERLNISEAMDQATRDALRFRDGLPTVFHRRNRQQWLVTMRLDDWIRIYRKALTGKKGRDPPNIVNAPQ